MEEERGDEDDDSELNERIQHAKLLDDLLQKEFADVAKAMDHCSCLNYHPELDKPVWCSLTKFSQTKPTVSSFFSISG